jgi:hypothetical protein
MVQDQNHIYRRVYNVCVCDGAGLKPYIQTCIQCMCLRWCRTKTIYTDVYTMYIRLFSSDIPYIRSFAVYVYSSGQPYKSARCHLIRHWGTSVWKRFKRDPSGRSVLVIITHTHTHTHTHAHTHTRVKRKLRHTCTHTHAHAATPIGPML